MKVMFGAGGTGGHISPAFAIARELQKLNCSVCFVGNKNSLESKMCQTANLPFFPIYVQKLYRKVTFAHISFPFHLIKSTLLAKKYINIQKPDLVFCTGGFVSGPVAIAAIISRVPLYFHESNSFPGITIRLLARFATTIFTASDSVNSYLSTANTVKVGIPINPALTKVLPFDPAAYRMSADTKKILIVGGSQGSLAINEAIDAIIPELLHAGYQIFWQTGTNSLAKYATKHINVTGLFIFGFSENLPVVYNNSHLAIARAGAMTIAELEAVKLPAILIPLPSSAENHQFYNALEQQTKNVALLLEQRVLTPTTLLDAIKLVFTNLETYKANLNQLPANCAVTKIVSYLMSKHHETRSQ